MAENYLKRALMAAIVAVAALCAFPTMAFAEDVEQLSAAYTAALRGYEDAVDEQEQNAEEIAALETEIRETARAIDRAQGELNETAVSTYKGMRDSTPLIEMLLDSESFSDAVMRYETYEKVENYCMTRIQELEDERGRLSDHRDELETRKATIQAKVDKAKREADEAERALLLAMHADGAEYHQKQDVSENCGATAFIVTVNALLHENRYTDNEEVWSSDAFDEDSTVDLVSKGQAWLEENDLDDLIAMEYIEDDVHETDELVDELVQGHIVIMSSGPGSVWQRANGDETDDDAFPGGHYAMFYRYADGIFYCNDSSVDEDEGAGVEYDEDQMQQWLDGRENHFAVTMYLK